MHHLKRQQNKSNKEVSTLIDFGSEANFMSQDYLAQLPVKILDTSWGLATIIKQQIKIQVMFIASLNIDDSTGQTW